MTTRTQAWPAGMPCWTDLATTDVAQAQDFYRAVLGWSFQPPAEDYGGYVMAEMAGHTAAGIGPLAEASSSARRGRSISPVTTQTRRRRPSPSTGAPSSCPRWTWAPRVGC